MATPTPAVRSPLPRVRIKAGVYYYVIQTKDAAGKRYQKWKRIGTNYADAVLEWAKLEHESVRVDRTFDSMLEEFQAVVVPGVAEATRKTWGWFFPRLTESFAGIALGDFQLIHGYQHATRRAKEGARVSGIREVQVARTMFGYAVEWGWIASNPFAGFKERNKKRRDRYISDDEFLDVVAKASPSIGLILQLCYCTGVRVSDALSIRREDIVDGALLIRHHKNKVRGRYPIEGDLKVVIEGALALPYSTLCPCLFQTRNGDAYSYAGYRSGFRRACAKAGVVDFHTHDVRGKGATDAEESGRGAQSLTLHEDPKEALAYVKKRITRTVQSMTLPVRRREKEGVEGKTDSEKPE